MKKILLSFLTSVLCTAAFADEGMWMVNSISRALVQKMQENNEGLEQCCNRFKVVKTKKACARKELKGKEYTKALYRSRETAGALQYPDANSTMRLTFGKVGTFKRNGVQVPWQTLSGEILAKEDTTSYDFTLKPEWRQLLQDRKQALPVNFITDNDITGGNSGSPVLDARGDIIGLAFDGNKESLASDVQWVEGWTKCVCVDIRFVLWTLDEYMGMDRILDEIHVL